MINKMEGHRVNVNVTRGDQPPDETLEGSRPRAGTMGEVTSQSPRQNRRRQQPFYGQGKAISIVNVSQLEGGGYFIQPEKSFPKYLINCLFLLKFHTHLYSSYKR